MTKKLLLLITTLTLHSHAFAQSYRLSGKISDAQSGEYLPLATVYNKKLSGGTSSNDFGFYSMSLPKSNQSVEFSYIGYKTQSINLLLNNDTTINIALQPVIELNEVTVMAESNRGRLQSTKVSNHTISAKTLDELPSLLGETDIIKELRSLPGVSSGSDGTAGLIVRGSGPDQNLILYDGVPIYNINHLNSFFSVFNTDAIAHAEMYKGAYPARYGGRISSVVDIRMREGNLKKYEGKISVGTIASKFTFEGPIIKNKASFILSARRTYLDLFAYPAQILEKSGDRTNYFFNDYNLKTNYIINNKNRVYVSAYMGRDKFTEKSIATPGFPDNSSYFMNWGNSFVSSRWNHQIGNKTFMNLSAYYYQYQYKAANNREQYNSDTLEGFQLNSHSTMMHDWSLKSDFDLAYNNNHYVRYGAQYIYHRFFPNSFSISGNLPRYDPYYNLLPNNDTTTSMGMIASHEISAYIEDEWSINTKLKLNAGLHYSAFAHQQEFYHYLMPHSSLVYMPNQQLSLKIASGMYSQYAFMVTQPTIGMPSDIWIQSVNDLKPMTGWQNVVGIMYNTKNELLLSAETFYKHTNNVAEFKEMVQYDVFDTWEDILSQGIADNYGFELMAEKRSKRYSLKASYAFIRATCKFSELNNGNPYPYSYDSPINVNIDGNIKISKKIDIGLSWCYASGKLITLTEQYYVDNFYFNDPQVYENYSDFSALYLDSDDKKNTASSRNNHRLPAYHRLDVGINLKKDKPRGKRVWSFGVYNAYNRKNAYYLNKGENGYEQYSISSIIPYVSYSFKF